MITIWLGFSWKILFPNFPRSPPSIAFLLLRNPPRPQSDKVERRSLIFHFTLSYYVRLKFRYMAHFATCRRMAHNLYWDLFLEIEKKGFS